MDTTKFASAAFTTLVFSAVALFTTKASLKAAAIALDELIVAVKK